VVERADQAVFALPAAQDLTCPIGQNLVGVHVHGSTSAALYGVDYELVHVLARDDLVSRGRYGGPDLGRQVAEFCIGERRRLLHNGQSDNEPTMHFLPSDVEVLTSAE